MENKTKSFTLDVKENDEGELYIEFSDEILDLAGWEIGDQLEWKDNGDGSWTLSKKVPENYVLVECISTFRTRYVVKTPPGEELWALDTVVCQDAKQFSSKYLDETIVSHRVVSVDEVVKLCDEDNDYATGWSTDKKMEVFVGVTNSHES